MRTNDIRHQCDPSQSPARKRSACSHFPDAAESRPRSWAHTSVSPHISCGNSFIISLLAVLSRALAGLKPTDSLLFMWRSEDPSPELALCCHLVGPRDGAQVMRAHRQGSYITSLTGLFLHSDYEDTFSSSIKLNLSCLSRH